MTIHFPGSARLQRLLPSRRRLAGSAALLAAGAVLLAPTTAHADTVPLQGTVTGTVTLTVNDVQKASNCTNIGNGQSGTKVPLTISINADDDYSYIWYDIYVLDSTGETVDATDMVMTVEQTSSGTYTGTLCSTLPVGSYTAGALVCFDATEDLCADSTDISAVTDDYRITAAAPHHYTVSAGRSGTTVAGTLLDYGRAVPGAAVTIQRKSGSAWVTAARRTTNSAGRVTAPGSYGTTYRVTYGSVASAAVGIPRASSTLSATRAKHGKHAWKVTARLGGPLHAGKRVYLQRLAGSTWRNAGKSCVTTSSGTCSVAFTQGNRRNDRVWYRLQFNPVAQKNAASSGRFHLTHR